MGIAKVCSISAGTILKDLTQVVKARTLKKALPVRADPSYSLFREFKKLLSDKMKQILCAYL